MNIEKAKELLSEPSTYVGFAAVIISLFGLDFMSAEQVAALIASIAGVITTEKAKSK